MLHYEWGNPSTIMVSGEEHEPEPEPTGLQSDPSNHVAFIEHQPNFNPFYDPNDTEFLVVPKNEEMPVDFSSRIGLNLGGRTYFSSSSEDDFVNRLYRRSRIGDICSTNSPKCQAEGCNADLTNAKHYHRRHKVCEFHSKASTVITAGFTQRFCQQCSRFHLLSEFDNGKRSCRKRLADHNRRRRKTQHSSQLPETTATPRSLMDSRDPSSWSVTVAVSPPGVSLDSIHQRSYKAMASSTSSNSLFYSTG